MRIIVEVDLGTKDLPTSKIKIFNHYGIIHHDELVKYLSTKFGCSSTDASACILEILESYCLIYSLSTLHCELLGLKSKDACLADGNYLIPMKLQLATADSDDSLFSESYKFEFDFHSYLPTEVYVHTVCYFLNMMKHLEGEFESNYVVLTSSFSRFLYVRLKSLPKAHWKIEMNQETQTLVFNIV